MRRAALFSSLLLAVSACHKEAKPPPPPEKCAKVERGADRVIDVVICSGSDEDGDGVDDAVDLCPDLQETDNGLLDKDGCPDPDRDLDGFLDYEDACPNEAGAPPDGCPFLDEDGDGIAQHLDACPHRPEDFDGVEDDDGCPEGMIVRVQARTLEDQLWQRARVDVRRGRALLTKSGAAALEELAEAVGARSDDIARVRVVGYASPRESRRGRAKDLAKERVRFVERRLKKAGLAGERFERAVYPILTKSEGAPRVDVMVFLDLAAATASPAPSAPDAGPAEEPRRERDAGPPREWDEVALDPYEEPAADPSDQDWDLVVQ